MVLRTYGTHRRATVTGLFVVTAGVSSVVGIVTIAAALLEPLHCDPDAQVTFLTTGPTGNPAVVVRGK